MSSLRIKDKLSAIVASQLPEYVRSDYPKFIAFVEAYYRFLEQDQGAFELIQNSQKYSDINLTSDAFLNYFFKNYAYAIPPNLLANKKLFIKNIKDLQEAKGSELSFKILFRLLFNTNVDVYYPYEYVLRASDGRWSQRVSIGVLKTSGTAEGLTNRLLTYQKNQIIYRVPILDVRVITSSKIELFLDSSLLPPEFTIGDSVSVINGGSTIFAGTITTAPIGYTIAQKGVGFKVGQIFAVNYSGITGTTIKVTEVDSVGGITKLKLISFGFGYADSFSVDLSPDGKTSINFDAYRSSTYGTSDSGSVTLYESNAASEFRYFDTDYVSDVYTISISGTSSFADVSISTPETTSTSTREGWATIRFTFGSLARYPGSFVTNNGFLSEPDIKLQDDQLYQPYAYQTKTEVDISDFYDVVKELIHPAGQNLFNDRTLTINIDLTPNVAVTSSANLRLFGPTEEILATDYSNIILQVNKTIEDPQDYPQVSDQITSFNVTKGISESTVISDNAIVSLVNFLYLDSNVSTSDHVNFLNLVEDTLAAPSDSYTLDVNKNTESTANITEATVISTSKEYSDAVSMTDNVFVGRLLGTIYLYSNVFTSDDQLFYTLLDDTINLLETVEFTTTKPINNTETITNVVEALSGVLLTPDDYFGENYILNDFVGSALTPS